MPKQQVGPRFTQTALESIEQAILYALYVVLITLLDALQRVVHYAAPWPLGDVLRWLPGIALVLLAAEVVIQTGIRVAFDSFDRVTERLKMSREEQSEVAK